MHLLVTTDTLGGVWTYTRELVSGLAQRGWRITLVSFGKMPDAEMTRWLRFSSVELRPTAFKLEWMDDSQRDIAEAREYMRDLVREVRPDLLHTNQFAFADIGLSVPTVLVAHSDVLSWWRAVYGQRPPDGRFFQWYEQLVSEALRAADVVVTPSHSALADLRESYGFESPARVIANGRSPASLNPYVTKDQYAASVGRLWDGGKQTALLCRQDLALEVRVAGSVKHPSLGERAVVALPGLTFVGEVSEDRLMHLLSRARVYIGTSRYEPFGLAPLEAALSRCALLLNDIPTFRELWGDAALYFATNDGKDMAKWLDRLASDETLSRACARAAYQRARTLYSAARMTDAYADLYRGLCAERKLAPQSVGRDAVARSTQPGEGLIRPSREGVRPASAG